MLPELGQIALILALLVSLAQAVLPMIGARGLLIGIGIGLLMMAFRVLFGMEGSGND